MRIIVNDEGKAVIQDDILVFVDGQIAGSVVALDTVEGWVDQRLFVNQERVGTDLLTRYELKRTHGKITVVDGTGLPLTSPPASREGA